jgi:RNA polymerase sigma factor (sigma-70 family)
MATTNGDLLVAAGAGDAAAWQELVDRYGGLVRATARGYRLQDADAADAVQNTWLRLVEHGSTVQDPDRLGGWLSTTAARECLAILRRRREVPDDATVTARIDTDPGAGARRDAPEQVVLAREASHALGTVVRELPDPRQRLIRELFRDDATEGDGLRHARPDYRRVAAVMQMPVGSIGPTRSRTLDDLRRRMTARGFGPSAA